MRNVSVATDWQPITIAFSSFFLEAGNDPLPMALATDRLVSLQLVEPASSESYNLWIDDVAFVR